jgi:hypothetical protein
MRIGRVAAGVGLAAVVIGGTAGTALAAGHSSSTAKPVAAVQAVAQTPALTKMTMAELTAKLGSSETPMIKALDDMKMTVVDSKPSAAEVKSVMIKVLSTDLGISSANAEWAVDEIDGGYVDTRVNWGF